eukprot:1137760-Pelagomonas_calceolata.AAC.2
MHTNAKGRQLTKCTHATKCSNWCMCARAGAEHAHQLGALLSGLKVLLNLIPWNPVLAAKEAHDYSAPSQDSILQFQSIVRTHYQVPTTVRQEKGQDISGACGQLALEKAAAARKGGLGGSRDVPAGAGAGASGASAATGGDVQTKHPEGSGAGDEAEMRAEEGVERERGEADSRGVGSSGRGSRRGGLLGGLVRGLGGVMGAMFSRGSAPAPTTAADDAAGAAATERSGGTATLHESKTVAEVASSSSTTTTTTTQVCNNTTCVGIAEGSREAGRSCSSKGDSKGSLCNGGSSSGEAVQGCCGGAEASTTCCAQGTDLTKSDCNQDGLVSTSSSMPGISINNSACEGVDKGYSMPGISASNIACEGVDKGHPEASSSSRQGAGSDSSWAGADATNQLGSSEGLSDSVVPPILRDIEELH